MPVVQEVVADPALKGDQEAEASVAQKEEAASSSSGDESDDDDSPIESEPETEGPFIIDISLRRATPPRVAFCCRVSYFDLVPKTGS